MFNIRPWPDQAKITVTDPWPEQAKVTELWPATMQKSLTCDLFWQRSLTCDLIRQKPLTCDLTRQKSLTRDLTRHKLLTRDSTKQKLLICTTAGKNHWPVTRPYTITWDTAAFSGWVVTSGATKRHWLSKYRPIPNLGSQPVAVPNMTTHLLESSLALVLPLCSFSILEFELDG